MRVLAVFSVYWVCLGSAWAAASEEVCHPTGNGAVHSLFVAPAAVGAHLRHGDYPPIAFYADADGDGYGDPGDETVSCEAPVDTVANADDCDDANALVRPDPTDPGLCTTELDGWTATAGRVVQGPTAGSITGAYAFTRLSETSAATRGGGSCMVADLFTTDAAWASFSCAGNSDCNNPANYTGPFRYCASPHGSGEPMRCWTRPTDNCSRSGFRTPGTYPLNVTGAWLPSAANPTTPGSEIPKAPVSGDATGRGEDVRWMVVTCMAVPGNPTGCGSLDRSQHDYSYGPVFWWTAPE